MRLDVSMASTFVARAYLLAMEEFSGCRLAIVATGADRDDTIVLDDPFA